MEFRRTAVLACTIATIVVGCGSNNNSSNPTATPVPATPTAAVTATVPATATQTTAETPPPTATPPNPTIQPTQPRPRPTNPTIQPTQPPTATPTSVAQCFDTTLSASVCDPAVATFSLTSTNPYYPLHPGLGVVLEGEEDGELIRVERIVLEDTEIVAGVETHVLEHKEYIDGELHELARNFYVEADDGTVCYFGEDVEFYEDGELLDTHGTWRVGVDGAKPGIIMPANPEVGDAYFQENAPGIAADMGRVSDVGVSRTIGGIDYDNLVVIQDSNPMEDCDEEEEKVYAPGIGEIQDDVLVAGDPDAPVLSQSKLLIEHNATDEDTGFQGFADGDPWNELTITGPGDVDIVTVTAAGGLFDFGLTELFFETSEPENAEVPIDDVLARLPEGIYTMEGDLVDAGSDTRTATLTHDIPSGVELLTPEDGDFDLDPANVVVSWGGVSQTIDGDEIDIVGIPGHRRRRSAGPLPGRLRPPRLQRPCPRLGTQRESAGRVHDRRHLLQVRGLGDRRARQPDPGFGRVRNR